VCHLLNFSNEAWSSCPTNVQATKSCLNTTDWRIIVPFNTKMTISERRASTVFDRFNFTITDIIDFSPPTPTNYTAEDFFTFYDIIFNIDQTQANWPASTQYMFLLAISIFLGTPTPTQNGTGTDDRLSRLEEFLATPIFLFNNAMFTNDSTPIGMGKSATIAMRSYRVHSILRSTNEVGHCAVYLIFFLCRRIHHPSLGFHRPHRSAPCSDAQYVILS